MHSKERCRVLASNDVHRISQSFSLWFIWTERVFFRFKVGAFQSLTTIVQSSSPVLPVLFISSCLTTSDSSSKTTGTLSISSSSATPTTTAYGIRTGVSRWLLRPPPGLYPSDNPSAEPTTSTSSATSSSNPSTTLLTITSPHPSAGLYPIESASGNEWGMVVPVSPDAPDNGWIPAGDAKPPTPNSLSTITKIGIGAGVLFGFLTALFFAVPFYRDKRAKGRIPKVKVVSSDDSLPIGNAGAAGIELPERAHLRELQAHDTARVAGVL